MNPETHPRLPLPEPRRGLEPGSFAEHTMKNRLPRITRQVIADNDYPPEIVEALQALMAELPGGPLLPLNDPGAPDLDLWEQDLRPHLGETYLEAPWVLAETYYFRRILQACAYFQPGPLQGKDPFLPQKEQGFQEGLEQIRAYSAELNRWIQDRAPEGEVLEDLLHRAVWGNQADLSVFPAGGDSPSHTEDDDRRAHMLVDDSSRVIDRLRDTARRVDFVMDNSALELFQDLALADFLLTRGLVAEVWLHCKRYPTYVSDVTPAGVLNLTARLQEDADADVRFMGRRLRGYLVSGRLVLQDHPFWNTARPTWEMPDDLRQTLAAASLVLSKGDLNYRRLFDDRHWEVTTPLQEVLGYLPAPWAMLRVLKSETVLGLPPGAAEAAASRDPEWLISGRWAVLQYQPLNH